MDELHIRKHQDKYLVHYNKRKIECQNLDEAIESNIFSRCLKEHIKTAFHKEVERISVFGFGEWWWAEAETRTDVVETGDNIDPFKALSELNLLIEQSRNET